MAKVLDRFGVCFLASCVCLGCESPTSTPAPSSTGSGQLPPAVSVRTVPSGEPNVAPSLVASRDETPASQPSVVPLAPPVNSPAPASSPARPAQQIHLSAGVALPQSLPDGTSMMISMDFQWLSGAPESGVVYVWVVETGNGQRLSGPANVSKPRGTVQAILRGVRPDQGPFRGAIFAKTTGTATGLQPLSSFVDLR